MPIQHALLLSILVAQGGSVLAQSQPASAPGAEAPAKVLYVGNSYTYYHRMPTAVSAMARTEASPRQLHNTVVAVPAATLQAHWEARAVQTAIHERKWRYVVLQEQSVLPLKQPERMHEYVRLFDKEIRQNGARTVLFLTWARRDQPDTQAALNAAYCAIAEDIGALVAPVGPAWRIARQRAPDLQLHEEDGSHPTLEGSYLTACVLYLTLQPAESLCPAPQGGANAIRGVDTLRAAAVAALATQRH